MRRLVPVLGAVLMLALTSTAAADTFKVAHPHAHRGVGSSGAIAFTAAPQSSAPIAFTAAQSGPMSFAALRGIWQAAGNAYGIPWEVLGAINKVETDFGRNLGPSSAGAIGWMQFMPSTWARWGIDANGDGVADPNNPTDAIFSAARYLAGCGGQFDIASAVYCYNHATWYVNEVLGLAASFSRGGGAGLFAAAGGAGLVSVNTQLPQIHAAQAHVAALKRQITAARANAHRLARAEHRFLRAATTAQLLSNQLAAHKRAVLIGIRRDTANARVALLRKRLHSASAQLANLKAGGVALTGQSNSAVSIALQYLGVPYRWAGASPTTGFDCSGLVQYVFAQLGMSLPHNTVAQWNSPQAVSVPRNELQPGDLVFFNKLDHVGIYIGNGYFVDAPHTGAFVRIDSLGSAWSTANYDGAKRIVGASFGGTGSGATSFTSSSNTMAFSLGVVYFTR